MRNSQSFFTTDNVTYLPEAYPPVTPTTLYTHRTKVHLAIMRLDSFLIAVGVSVVALIAGFVLLSLYDLEIEAATVLAAFLVLFSVTYLTVWQLLFLSWKRRPQYQKLPKRR